MHVVHRDEYTLDPLERFRAIELDILTFASVLHDRFRYIGISELQKKSLTKYDNTNHNTFYLKSILYSLILLTARAEYVFSYISIAYELVSFHFYY